MTLLPFAARAAGHASVVLEAPASTIYIDPVGDAAQYADFPAPDLILVTHEHGDHYNADLLAAIKGDATLITNPAVAAMLPEGLSANSGQPTKGESVTWNDVTIDAIPAYKLTEERKNFHPVGRDNGYVLGLAGFTVYVSGDTEDIPDTRALTGIDLAFV